MSNPFKVGDIVTPVKSTVRYCTTGNIYEVRLRNDDCIDIVDDDGDLSTYLYSEFKLAQVAALPSTRPDHTAAVLADNLTYEEKQAAKPVTSQGRFSKGQVLVYCDGTMIPNDEARTVTRCTATCVWFEETYSMPFNPTEFTEAY